MNDALDDLSGPALRLLESVEEVTIVKGHIPSDPTFWHIKIEGKTIEVNAEKMTTPTRFKQLYLKNFYLPAPSVKTDEWNNLLKLLAEQAQVVTAQEESEHVYIANQMIEEIRRLPVVDSIEDYNRGLVLHSGCYLLPGSKIDEIIVAHNWKTSAQILSPVMSDLGFKLEGTHATRDGEGKLKRFWWFRPSAIFPEDSPNPPKNEITGGLS